MPSAAVGYARRVFTLDARSLALMRMAVALTVLVDLWVRSTHLLEHYSDAGVLPRPAAFVVSGLARVSLLSLSGEPVWALTVFLAAGVLASFVLVGFRSQLSTALLWLFVLSIQHRNPLVWDHRDVLVSSALGLGLLLRWGDAWSLDARRNGGPRAGHSRAGAGAALYVCQIACIYGFAALLKSGPEWRTELSAVERAVGLQYWATALAPYLLGQPRVMMALTAGVWWFELLVPAMLLSPWQTARLRAVVVAGLCLMQLGFGLFLWLDTFPMISASISLGLLPASLWSRKEPIEPPLSEPRWERGLALGLLGYMLALNLLSLRRDRGDAWLRLPAEMVGLDQCWSM
ncbi:MAG: HTTM domain-containing protein, partial [Myxococcales bacterium]|nr:HTTM domain-containing protein [Myxococcales bacterium]